jgi:DNA-binding CsgD family transcriptional regulator
MGRDGREHSMDRRLERAPLGVLEVSADGAVRAVNGTARELLDAGDVSPGDPIEAVGPRSVEDSLLDAVGGDAVAETEFEEYYPDLDRWLAVSVLPGGDSATVYLRDVTSRRRRAETVERLRAERRRTAVIDGVLSAVLADLVGASSRAEIAETICAELGGSDRYEFAWVGEQEVGGGDLVVRASAGETGETFAAIRAALDEDATTAEERAVETGRLQTVQPLAEETAVPESVRMAGFADGVQSALAIPLVYASNVYGVVGVYASGTDAFAERERTSFETLGEVAGFAVTAARNRSLLLSDAVTEVTFEVGTDSVLAALGAELDATITLEGVVPRGTDTMLCFVGIETATGEAVEQAAAGRDGVGEVRPVEEGEGGCTVAIELRDGAPLLAAASRGGTVRSAEFEGGAGRFVVDLPRDGDVRRVADAVAEEYDAEVVAKRERERSVTTEREFRDELDTRLTDRQRTALRTAYLADYFESPRGSTAEEVAESLDIAGSTLLYHLRAGQRKLLDAFFGEAGQP